MATWEDFLAGSEDEDEEYPYSLTRSMRDPYLSNLSDFSDFDSIDRYERSEDESIPSSSRAMSYLQAALESPPSEKMYSEYISRRPHYYDEEYRPSIGRRIGAALFGAGAGAIGKPELGMSGVEKIIRAPYERAFENWKTQGLDIATRARLADAARNRKLMAFRELLRGEEREKTGLRRAELEHERTTNAAERAALTEQRRLAGEERAEGREQRAESREQRLTEQFNRTQNRLEGEARERTEGKQRALEAKRFNDAKVRAHSFIRDKFPEKFSNPNDPRDFSLSNKLTGEERRRVIDMIKQQEDFYLRLYGLKEEE